MDESLFDYIRHHCARLVGKKIYIRFRCDRQGGAGETTNDSWMMGRIDNILYHAGTHIEISSGMESVYIFPDCRVSYHPSSLNASITVSVVSLTIHDVKYQIPRP